MQRLNNMIANAKPGGTPCAAEMKGLSWKRNKKVVLSDINIRFSDSTTTLLTGPNGSGKTSLFILLADLVKPTKGTISFEPSSASFPQGKADISFQNPVFDTLGRTQEEEFTLAGIEENDLAFHIALLLGIDLSMPLPYYSFGQQKLLSLLKCINNSRPILLLDEPFVALDKQSVDLAKTMIDLAIRYHRLTVIASPREKSMLPIGQTVFMKNGRLVDLRCF